MPYHWRGPWAALACPQQAVEGRICSPHLARYPGPSTGCTEGHALPQQHLLLDGHMYFTFCTRSLWWGSKGSLLFTWQQWLQLEGTDWPDHQSTHSCSINMCRTQWCVAMCVQRQAIVRRTGTPSPGSPLPARPSLFRSADLVLTAAPATALPPASDLACMLPAACPAAVSDV